MPVPLTGKSTFTVGLPTYRETFRPATGVAAGAAGTRPANGAVYPRPVR